MSNGTIETVVRISDRIAVPIVLKPTKAGWLKAITVDGQPILHCRKGHLLIRGTTYIDRQGYLCCMTCRRRSNHKVSKTHNSKYYRAHRYKEMSKSKRKYAILKARKLVQK